MKKRVIRYEQDITELMSELSQIQKNKLKDNFHLIPDSYPCIAILSDSDEVLPLFITIEELVKIEIATLPRCSSGILLIKLTDISIPDPFLASTLRKISKCGNYEWIIMDGNDSVKGMSSIEDFINVGESLGLTIKPKAEA